MANRWLIRPPAERFHEKVDRSSGPDACWPWTGYVNKGGYGLFHLGTSKRTVYAHRFAFELANGRPAEFDVDHECHNRDESCRQGGPCPHRRCCNPAHLVDREHGANVRRGGTGKVNHRNAAKTQCPQGHLYDEANTGGEGVRWCRACARDREAAKRRTANAGPANAAKTHCPRDHLYDEANTGYSTKGGRYCRRCARESAARRRQSAEAVAVVVSRHDR